jgi:type II secretory ATPase GspE/PulE/Tfp pilus assembly ATPase PilB-like protein
MRKVCRHCKTTYHPDGALCEYLGVSPDLAGSIELVKGTGCDSCFNTGFFGRVGVFEIMGIDSDIRAAILQNRPHNELMEVAVANGMQTLEMSAKKKVLDGITSVEEIHRVLTTYSA